MAKTRWGEPLEPRLLENYLNSLVGRFFKMLPMWEGGEKTVFRYMDSLQRELVGFRAFIPQLAYDKSVMELLALVQYLLDHPNCEIQTVRTEVFRAISICKRLAGKFAQKEE